MSGEAESVRIDRWLWAARFYKTRSAATRAVRAGKVRVNRARPKSSSPVSPGDRVEVRKPPYVTELVVKDLAVKRGPASEAAKLYEETSQSRRARERRAWQMRHVPVPRYEGKGRPTKKERRELDQLRDELRPGGG